MRQTQPGWSWNGPEIPETKAPLAGILVARDGNIWARVASPSERIPDAELPLRGENRPGGKPGTRAPVRHYRSHAIYEVFSPGGRFLGRVPLPPRMSLVQADGDYVWGIIRDEDDLPSIVRLKLNKSFGEP